jgi:hypothetical protein
MLTIEGDLNLATGEVTQGVLMPTTWAATVSFVRIFSSRDIGAAHWAMGWKH